MMVHNTQDNWVFGLLSTVRYSKKNKTKEHKVSELELFLSSGGG
jgi:hypothetical protein